MFTRLLDHGLAKLALLAVLIAASASTHYLLAEEKDPKCGGPTGTCTGTCSGGCCASVDSGCYCWDVTSGC